MKSMSVTNSSLVSKCMDFTKHLANKGTDFKFSLSLPTGFNFSMDFSQDKMTLSWMPEKKKSPITLKRNSLRKKNFLEKKAKESQAGTQPAGSPAQSIEITFKCDQCEALFKSKDTLDNHIDKPHTVESSEVTFKSNQCGAGVKSKDSLEIHIQETHTEKLTCKECDYTSTTVKNINGHSKMEHKIELLDGSTEIKKSDNRKEHDDL